MIYRHLPDTSRKKKLAQEAAGWIWWDGEEFMTFKYVCLTLGLDPSTMRERILRLRREDFERSVGGD